jgi:hypothetical protein
MKQFNAWSFTDVVRLYHHDAENQLSKPNMYRTIESAKNQALNGVYLLKNHGEALKVYSPKIYNGQISGLLTLIFLSSNRLKGINISLSYLSYNIISLRSWVIYCSGSLAKHRSLGLNNFERGYINLV